ncbi:uncharacterized protein LOC135484793 [Lineus longissimus]|uniref:uncharacterized protein LOC135484793 n=1 Tax=Lineus longissimus TaxID=88925 RepID=UPI00315DDD50
MTPSHRVDTLTDALIHYANRNYLKIGTFLSSKMEKAKDVAMTSSKELTILLSTMQATTADVRNWMLVEERSAAYKRHENWPAKSGKDKLLPLLHLHCTERKILLEMMNKYAVGQAIAIRLQKNINNSNKAIRSLIAQVNKELTPPLTYEEAIEFKFLVDSDRPYQRRAANVLNMKERAEEEIELLKKEIANVAMVMRRQHATLISSLSSCDSSDSFSRGRNSLIVSKIVLVERQFSTFKNTCGAYVEIQQLTDSFRDRIPYTLLEVDDIGFSSDDLTSILEEIRAQEAEDDIVSDNENEDKEDLDEEYSQNQFDYYEH